MLEISLNHPRKFVETPLKQPRNTVETPLKLIELLIAAKNSSKRSYRLKRTPDSPESLNMFHQHFRDIYILYTILLLIGQ